MNTFDKNIKKKLYNAEMLVDDGIWSSIESQIPVKKEKPKVWLLFLVLAFTLPYLLIVSNRVDTNSMQTADISNGNKGKTDKHTYTDQKNTTASVISNTNASSTKKDNGLTNTASLLNTSNTYSNYNITNSQNKNQNLSELTSTSTIQNRSSSFSSNYNSLSQEYQAESLSSTDKKLTILNNPFRNKKTTSILSEFKLIEKSRIYKSVGKTKAVLPLRNKHYDKGICYSHLAKQSRAIIGERTSVALCPSFEKRYSGFYLYLDANYGMSSQNLSTRYSEFNNLVAERNRNENGTFALSANIGIGKKWSNGIFLETGLNYDRINISADNYVDDTGSRLLIEIDSINTVNGWMTTIDSTYITLEEGKVKPNRFTQINFPLALGYELLLRDSWSIVAKTGVLFNISSTNSGTLIDEEGQNFVYNSNNELTRFYKTNLGLSFIGGLHLQKDLSPITTIYSGINVNYYPNNFSLANNPIEQTYTKVGLTAGMKYRL